jgi:transglutaminase-like putative cysteine protease
MGLDLGIRDRWVDFDATNGLMVQNQHITAAFSCDYADVSQWLRPYRFSQRRHAKHPLASGQVLGKCAQGAKYINVIRGEWRSGQSGANLSLLLAWMVTAMLGAETPVE